MTPDQQTLINELHRRVARLPRSQKVEVEAGHIVQLINFLRMEERVGAAAEDKLRRLLTKAAEENLETLLTDA